jgi:signal transduction histidine kinase/ActR/RegA family two-component response regulator/HPt (histidine-containing phosphotransfer) domain-containing protein
MSDMPNIENASEMADIFEAMAEFYYAIYVVDIKNDRFEVLRGTKATAEALNGCESYSQAAEKFISIFVFPDDRDSVRRFASVSYLGGVLSQASPYCRVEARQGSGQRYEWVAVVFKAVEFCEGKASRAVLAVENIDGMRSSLMLDEQTRMQNFARKLNADAERRIRSISERTNDERSAMLLRLNSQGRLLYLALQKSATQAFEYDIASDRISTILEWNGSCETVSYDGGADFLSKKHRCSEKDTLALESAFGTAADGEDAEVDFVSEKDGEPRFKRLSLYVMRLRDMPTGTLVGVISDVTREKLLSKQAEREQEFRRSVLGSSAYGMEIELKNNRWKYLWRNGDANEMRQSDDYDGDILSPMVKDNVLRDDYSVYAAAMNRQSLLKAYEEGRTELSVDYRVLKDGKPVWFRNEVHLLEDAESGEIRANVYVSDINLQKLRELSEDEAKKELAEKAQAEKRANELKSRFLANMSHELRTPLSSMLGMSELVLREDMPNQARGYVKEMRAAGEDLLGILNGILDLARIEAGGMELTEGAYRPMELLNDVAGMFEYQAAEKSLRFDMELSPEMPSVLYGDEAHLRQVFVNLVSNALRYTDEGGITVTMGLAGMENGCARIACAVSDTGAGINPQRLGDIFDEYDTPEGEGAGLSLAISRQLVSLMGGEMRVKSEYGRGSRFYFELSQRAEDPAPGGAFRRRERENRPEGRWGFSAPDATVLLVDDNSVNLRVDMGLLRPYGMRIIAAVSGEEALRILKKEKVDLVLMDQLMPEMDGVETTRRIRAMGGGLEALPVIALTANAMKGVREELIGQGMDDYITKPIDLSVLGEKLLKWLPPETINQPGIQPERASAPDTLPDIEGIDTGKGLSYVCTFDDYLTCLRDFRSIIPEKSARIEELAAGGDIPAYTTEVHGLKSSARLIGADVLADMAEGLEKAGRSGNTEEINRDTGRLLNLYRAFYDRLQPFAGTEDETGSGQALTDAEFISALKELRGYVDGYDCDSADHWSEKLSGAAVSEKYGKALEMLHRYILAAQFSSCATLIDEILNDAG